MAGKSATLVVKILGDSTGATKAIAQVEGATAQVTDVTAKGGAKMAGIWTGVATAITATAKAASDLEQATGAVAQVFGDSADEVMAWAEGMAAYGLSTAQAAQAATVLGATLNTKLGLPMEQTAALTTQLIELGADMAHVFGGTTAQAVGTLGAAMRGEFDSIERYGISLTAASVEAEAMALAAQGVTFASEEQAKALATLSLIQQQTTSIQGAATEGQDTLASSTERLRGEVVNLAAAIGTLLIPILTPLIQGITEVVIWFTEAISSSQLLQAASAALTAVLAGLADILDPVLVNILNRAQQALDTVARLIDTYVMPVIDALTAAFDRLAEAIGTVVGWVQSAIDWFNDLISTVHEAIDTLTFWNDTYSESSAGLALAAPSVAGTAAPAAAARSVHIDIHAGVGSDPRAIAREIRKVLREDDQRFGRRR